MMGPRRVVNQASQRVSNREGGWTGSMWILMASGEGGEEEEEEGVVGVEGPKPTPALRKVEWERGRGARRRANVLEKGSKEKEIKQTNKLHLNGAMLETTALRKLCCEHLAAILRLRA